MGHGSRGDGGWDEGERAEMPRRTNGLVFVRTEAQLGGASGASSRVEVIEDFANDFGVDDECENFHPLPRTGGKSEDRPRCPLLGRSHEPGWLRGGRWF